MTAKKNKELKKGKEIRKSGGTVGISGGTRMWDWSSLDQKQLDEIIIHVKTCIALGHECNCRNKWLNQNV